MSQLKVEKKNTRTCDTARHTRSRKSPSFRDKAFPTNIKSIGIRHIIYLFSLSNKQLFIIHIKYHSITNYNVNLFKY